MLALSLAPALALETPQYPDLDGQWVREPHPLWPEFLCTEANNHIPIGREFYFRSGDGYLMPAYKDQPPPDLRNFMPARQVGC